MSKFEKVGLIVIAITLSFLLFISLVLVGPESNKVKEKQKDLCKKMCEVSSSDIRTFDTNACVCK